MTYNWTNQANDKSQLAASGQLNTVSGMHNMSGVHSSEFAKNDGKGGLNAMQPAVFYDKLLLERKRLKGGDLVFANFAEKRSVEKVGSTNLRRYQPLKAHSVALVEGNPPRPDLASGKAISATTRQYGRFMEFTDLFEVKTNDPVISEYVKELADVANETIDLLAQAALLAEAQIFFPVASGAADKNALVVKSSTDKEAVRPTIADLRIIALTMKAAKVGKIGGHYVVLHSPAVGLDLQEDIRKHYYQGYGQAYEVSSEGNTTIKPMFELRFVEAMSAMTESFTSTGTVATSMIHHTIVLGAKAYTRLEIAGNGAIKTFFKGLGSAGTLDPIDQRMTIGWKINALGFKVTDPDAVVDYMSIPSQADIVVDSFDYVDANLTDSAVSTLMLDAEKTLANKALDPNKAVGLASDLGVLKSELGQFAKQDADRATHGSVTQIDAKEKSEVAEIKTTVAK